MKERLRTIAAIIALVASGPTLTIAAGNWSGYLIISYWRESNARNITAIDEASSRSIAPSAPQSRRTTLRLVSST
jgi:hypothetical protein